MGVIDRSVSLIRKFGKIDAITFDMGSTSVPGEIPNLLQTIKSVRLEASGPMFFPAYYRSEQVTVR